MGKTVLTIDDSKTLRLIIAKHMTPFGVKIHEAENGEQGLTLAREVAPDLILLDYNMPVMDGYHTLIELKSDPELKPIPVVMLTTETVKETVVKLMKLGLQGYISKPFSREVLLQKVNPILGLFNGNEVPSDPPLATPTPKPAQPVAPEAIPGKPAILAIDDKENILNLLKQYIGEDFQVITADSGKAALAAIAHTKFDFVFLDMSLPDMNALDIYTAYEKAQGNGRSARQVVVMPLRTAQADIERAQAQGIRMFLYKPFTKEDVAQLVSSLDPQQQKIDSNPSRFLSTERDIRVLSCPPEKSPMFRIYIGALANKIRSEIEEMAEEGLTKLIIEVNPGMLSDMTVTKKFIDLVEHASKLSMSIRFVGESQVARELLRQFAETASFPIDISLKCALNSMG